MKAEKTVGAYRLLRQFGLIVATTVGVVASLAGCSNASDHAQARNQGLSATRSVSSINSGEGSTPTETTAAQTSTLPTVRRSPIPSNELDAVTSDKPCSLVPVSFIAKWIPTHFNQAPVAVPGGTCQYSNIVNGAAAGGINISFTRADQPFSAEAQTLLQTPGFSTTKVGSLPAVVSDTGSGGFILEWAQSGLDVVIQGGANEKPVSQEQLLGLAQDIAGELS
jgi:hypothetical protein